MGAGEYVSVRSQRELLEAGAPNPDAVEALPYLDVDANELALVYRARGMSVQEAADHAADVLDDHALAGTQDGPVNDHEEVGTALTAAGTSFVLFASGAAIPVLPYLMGLDGVIAVIVASVLVGLALVATGAVVGLISGAPPLRRGLRQLAIGYGAAVITYLLGLWFGASIG
jgi:VIT1/CCC1 family predicted Fe2+/Mn2+ transporter